MGAGINDILIGLLIGNTLAAMSFWLITAPIAVKTRLSLYTYIENNLGEMTSRLYNGANVAIFVAISAAMITVSATAVRVLCSTSRRRSRRTPPASTSSASPPRPA